MQRTWIDVDDHLPKIKSGQERSALLLVWEQGRVERAYYHADGSWWIDNALFAHQLKPSHWMKMLTAPY